MASLLLARVSEDGVALVFLTCGACLALHPAVARRAGTDVATAGVHRAGPSILAGIWGARILVEREATREPRRPTAVSPLTHV